MPLVIGNGTQTLRIKHGTVDIKRVYLDKTLVGGLYEVKYNLAGGQQGSNPITEYVGGVAEEQLPVPTGEGQLYYTYFKGGYEGKSYVTAIPTITKDFRRDLDLYAKGLQKKYTYSGIYQGTGTEEIWVPGGGGEGGGFTPYTNTNPVDREAGQCTTYCYNRTKEAFGTPCLTSFPNAEEGLTGGTLGKDGTRIVGGSPQPGDVVVFGEGSNLPYGHVVFQETDSIITQSNVRRPGGGGNEVIADRYERFSCVSIGTPDSYLTGPRLGVLRYTGSGGGGGGHTEIIVHTETGNVPETDCADQQNPQQPSAPQGDGTSFEQYTYSRNYNYNINDGDQGGNRVSGGDLSPN